MASRNGKMEQNSKDSSSRTRGRPHVERATPVQVARQAIVIIVVVALWSALLAGFLGLTSRGEEETVALPTQVEETSSPTVPQPTATHTAVPTETLLPPPETAGVTATRQPTTAPEPTEPQPSPTHRSTAGPDSPGLSFVADVLPLLQTRCERCHGGRRTEAGLSTVSYADLMAGSYGVEVVAPGSAQDSRLVKVIISGDMPRRAPPMPEDEIDVISAWIDAGALDN